MQVHHRRHRRRGSLAPAGVLLMAAGLVACGHEGKTVTLPGGAARMEFVWIEPGTFVMGSPQTEDGRFEDEGPQHEVRLTQGLWMGKYEVTQGQWEAVMATRPWQGQDYVQQGPDYPATHVSWPDVQEFVRRLNQAAGEDLYRLPTEAEWEYACRAGTTTPWSSGSSASQLQDHAWYDGNTQQAGETYAHKVGTKDPNAWGLHDMHGNVAEWCQDWADPPYPAEPQVDPVGPARSAYRFVRGGAFNSSMQSMRSATRYDFVMTDRGATLGARLVMLR
ncbi:MAG: formylglycine-generating enzyme family protein [Candidatus Latescibacterota bacterium]